MLVQDAIKQGIKKIRLPHWEPSAYMELPLLPDGKCGPWVKIVDCVGEAELLITQVLNDPTDTYEPWEKGSAE